MAFIQARVSRGKKYWSIVECRRVAGKPRTFILEYLGTAATLLKRLQNATNFSIKSYSHGDTAALINSAIELDIVNIINKHIPLNQNNKQPTRDSLTVGASFLLGAIGRACHPTSKLGWYDWCKETSLEYSLKSSFKKIDSQHFWDQMNSLPVESTEVIEEEIVSKLLNLHSTKLDCLFFDTTNFFTFIHSTNTRCDLPQRGRNKQKRFDLRQIGLALLVSRNEQFPLFHKTYRGNKNDITAFKENCHDLIVRLKKVTQELADVTIVFDKGNNSKSNFAQLEQEDCYYVAGLVSSYFKNLIKEANENFTEITIADETLPAYRIKTKIWGCDRTCVITVSKQLFEGQLRGIEQHLAKKYKSLNTFKQQLENPKSRKSFNREEIEEQLQNIIRGQFIEEILKYEFITLENDRLSFSYFIDADSFANLQTEILGRQIVVTNRHDWSNEEILLAYRGQAKVEYAFRTLKNPYHMAIRPQYHWTDQKIEAHFLMCIIGYLLTIYTYEKVKKYYKRNIGNMLNDLRSIRLACVVKDNKQINYQLEKVPTHLQKLISLLNISNENIRPNLNLSVYN